MFPYFSYILKQYFLIEGHSALRKSYVAIVYERMNIDRNQGSHVSPFFTDSCLVLAFGASGSVSNNIHNLRHVTNQMQLPGQ